MGAGLLAALLSVACDLSSLAALSDAAILNALQPLRLKSLKLRKVQAAIISLRVDSEVSLRRRSAQGAQSTTSRYLRGPLDASEDAVDGDGDSDDESASDEDEESADAPSSVPHLGERNPQAERPRFKPRTHSSRVDVMPATPEGAARSLGLTGPSEARELNELATLLAGGQPSARASKWEANINAGVLATAAAKEAEVAALAAEMAATKEEDGAAAGKLAFDTPATTRTKAAADSLLFIDLQTALEEAASAKAAAGIDPDESPCRAAMMEANAEAKRLEKRKPRKKPPVAPTTRVTRSQARGRVLIPSGLEEK